MNVYVNPRGGVEEAVGVVAHALAKRSAVQWACLCVRAAEGDDLSKLDETAVKTATKLANMAPSAIRWTKYSLNNWLRQAGPIFDASLALEFLGFTGPEVREGVAAFREKRKPQFPLDSPL